MASSASLQMLRSSINPKSIAPLLALLSGAFGWYTLRSKDPPDPRLKVLNPSTFVPYTLVSKTPVSSTSSIFRLRPQFEKSEKGSKTMRDAWKKGVWSVQFKQPQLQIARNYTPLPISISIPSSSSSSDDDDEIHLLIRREEGGEVSNYLHDLPERSTISVRGPFEEFAVPEDVKDVLFLAGGTGIAPALQVANLLRMEGREGMRMRVLWANRRREDCLGGLSSGLGDAAPSRSWFPWGKSSSPSAQSQTLSSPGPTIRLIESLKAQARPGQLRVDYFVDEEKTFIRPDVVSRLLSPSEGKGKGKSLILISGPEGFVKYWAGRKEWADGREVQGVLGGELGRMERRGWEVVKI